MAFIGFCSQIPTGCEIRGIVQATLGGGADGEKRKAELTIESQRQPRYADQRSPTTIARYHEK